MERINELQYLSRNDDSFEEGFKTILVTQPEHPYVGAWWPPGHVLGWEHTHIHQIADLCDAIGNSTDPCPGFREGAENQAVLEAIEKSSRTLQWEEVEAI